MLDHKGEHECTSNAYGLAASRGRVDVLRWLRAAMPNLRCPAWAAETAAAAGHLMVSDVKLIAEKMIDNGGGEPCAVWHPLGYGLCLRAKRIYRRWRHVTSPSLQRCNFCSSRALHFFFFFARVCRVFGFVVWRFISLHR